MGESISAASRERIEVMTTSDKAVLKVLKIISTYQSPDEVILMLFVAFNNDLDTQEINEAIERIRNQVKMEFTLIKFVIIQPEVITSKITF